MRVSSRRNSRSSFLISSWSASIRSPPASACIPPNPSRNVQTRPPTRSRASTTIALRPRRWRWYAAASPASPPPTINTDALGTGSRLLPRRHPFRIVARSGGRRASVQRSRPPLRFEDDFQAVILLVQKHLEAVGRFVERQPVSDNKARIDIAVLNPFEQWSKVVLHVCLAGLDR